MSVSLPALRREKAMIISRLRRLVDPLMWDSFYFDAKNDPLKLWVRKTPIAINGLMVQQIYGMTKQGVITDVRVALDTVAFDRIPFEDLCRIEPRLTRAIQKGTKP